MVKTVSYFVFVRTFLFTWIFLWTGTSKEASRNKTNNNKSKKDVTSILRRDFNG